MATVTKTSLAWLQKLGFALMLPIAVMPVAALLLRLGQDDLLGIPFIASAGGAIFDHLGILFAIGVAVGFAKEAHGSAGLAGVVGYFVATESAKSLVHIAPDKIIGQISIPVGILCGILAGSLYNRFKDIKLPEYLAFFGGRRFIPIITAFCCLGLGLVFGFGWPYLTAGLDAMSRGVLAAGEAGHFFYGVLNRLLLVTGLHHIVNNIAWQLLGEFHGKTGDLNRFFAGDPTAGAFMAGFFPVMMFGLPAACLAMFRTAYTKNRRLVGGVLFSMALTSFLTGVTEPVEFAFMFLAPVLYLVHALLTGLSLVIMSLLNIKLGFGFSAGLFDYIICYGKATNPLLLLPVGAVYFVVYYVMFRVVITRFDLKTIGREPDFGQAATASVLGGLGPQPIPVPGIATGSIPLPTASAPARGVSYLAALGGAGNVLEIDACATRLRLSVVDSARLDEPALKQLGARAVLRLATGSAQVIIGPLADQVASEIQAAMRGPGTSTGTSSTSPAHAR